MKDLIRIVLVDPDEHRAAGDPANFAGEVVEAFEAPVIA